MDRFEEKIGELLRLDFGVTPDAADAKQLYTAVSRAAMDSLRGSWKKPAGKKRACYFSAEFLMGRLVNSNLMNLGLLERTDGYLRAHGRSVADFEQIEDDALGNGGLGRLAACFLDSAATHDIPLDGYGIRYRYGLFRQYFEDGFQRERADDWLRFGDPWSVRREAPLQKFLSALYQIPCSGTCAGMRTRSRCASPARRCAPCPTTCR